MDNVTLIQSGFRNSGSGGSGHPDLQNEEKGPSLNSCRTREYGKELCYATQSRHVFVYNKTKETFLAFRVNVADSILSRLVGLLGKRSLKPDSGVWIVPANAIHTIGMLFTFDLVLIDKDFKVVGLKELVRPFRVTRPVFRAESVLELPAHAIFKSRTEVGDQLVIERYEAKQPAVPLLPKPSGGSRNGSWGRCAPLQCRRKLMSSTLTLAHDSPDFSCRQRGVTGGRNRTHCSDLGTHRRQFRHPEGGPGTAVASGFVRNLLRAGFRHRNGRQQPALSASR